MYVLAVSSVLQKSQNWQIPADVDIRVMLTFLELYQTLLSFVFFKLYTDAGLVYPPPLDSKKDEGGAGIDALHMMTSSHSLPAFSGQALTTEGRSVSAKDVRQTIKAIDVNPEEIPGVDMFTSTPILTQVDEEFVPQTSTSSSKETASVLPTLQTLAGLPQTINSSLFSSFTFWLSREVSRSIFEFVVRSFGGRIGWPPSSGGGSPFGETDPNITHVITDRPIVEKKDNDPIQRELCARRKHIQPQWVVDCINAGKILLEDPYGQGKILPPHLSPFDECEGAYIPLEATEGQEEDTESTSGEEDGEKMDDAVSNAVASGHPTALIAAELEAEAAGVDYVDFQAEVHQAFRKQSKKPDDQSEGAEHGMNKMMMSNKQRKLYEKMKYSQHKKTTEVIFASICLAFKLTLYFFSA
jgi:pescadillo protein